MADNKNPPKPGAAQWVIYAFTAFTILIVLFGLAYIISGREVIERPILVFFLLLAWFGLLSGIVLSRNSS